jgi:uncharacterized membrane protein YphA (DoxX/SURF4 family)
MTQPLPPVPDAPPWSRGPGPRTRALIVLLLRVALGLQFLNAGVIGFLSNRAMPGRGPYPFGPGYPGAGMSLFPGGEILGEFLPTVEIVVGLALLLGFLTTVAAIVAAVLALAPSLLRLVAVLIGAFAGGLNLNGIGNPNVMGIEIVVLQLFPILLVIWFAQSAWDIWSLDGLMFAPRRTGPARVGGAPRAQRGR